MLSLADSKNFLEDSRRTLHYIYNSTKWGNFIRNCFPFLLSFNISWLTCMFLSISKKPPKDFEIQLHSKMAESAERWKKLFQDNREHKSKIIKGHADPTVPGLICTIVPSSGEIVSRFQHRNFETFLIRELICFCGVYAAIGSHICSVCISGVASFQRWINLLPEVFQ